MFSSIVFLLILLISIFVGLMLYSSKRYCEELYPGMDVGGYEDIAVAAFGTIGRVSYTGTNCRATAYCLPVTDHYTSHSRGAAAIVACRIYDLHA